MATKGISVILAVVVLLAPYNQGLRQTPKNTAVLVGQGELMLCQGQDGGIFSVIWRLGDAVISQDDGVVPTFRDSYTVIAESTQRIYNLWINSTARGLAGMYSCGEIGGKTAHAMHIVLDSDPSCSINITEENSKLDLIEGETLAVECETNYKSVNFWNPAMKVEDKESNTPLEAKNDVILEGERTKSTFTVKAMRGHQDSQFRLAISFPGPPDGIFPGDTNNVYYSRWVPDYKFQMETPPMDVKYQVENVRFDNEKGEYFPGDQINCYANGHPAPRVKWIDLDKNETIVSGGGLSIEEDMEGKRSFLCEATNEIRGITYTINKTSEFIVSIPTTTTTTTTTTTVPTTTEAAAAGLSAGAIAGIVIAALAVLIILLLIIFWVCCRRAPTKAPASKEKQKPPVDQVRQVNTLGVNKPTNAYDNKPIMDDYDQKPPPTISNGPNAWGDHISPPMYDVALDDTPRSRKPVQVYDSLDYTDFRRV